MSNLVINVLAYEAKSHGFDEYLFNLLTYFYERRELLNFSKIVIVCLESQKTRFVRYDDKFEIKTFDSHSRISTGFIQTFLPLLMGVRRDDVIFYPGNFTSLIKRSKQVLTIHDLLYKRKEWFPYKMLRLQRRIYLPLSIRLSDRIIAISNFTKKDILQKFPYSQGKIDAIYNDFNFNKYPVINVHRENYFISVCSSAYHKNTITVLKAFNQYVQQGGLFDLIFVGSIKENSVLGIYYNSLSKSVRDRVHVYTNISNEKLSELYYKAKVYISASLFEGLGMPIVEAMYFKLHLILTDDDVFREVSFNKARYINPLDETEISRAMLELQKISKQGMVSYNDELKAFSSANTSQRYIDLFNSL